jgi:neopullulanase
VGEIWQERGDLLDGRTYDGLMNYPLAAAIVSFVPGSHLDPRVVAQHAEIERQTAPADGAVFLGRLERVITSYAPAFARSQLGLLDSHDTPRFLSWTGGDRASLRLAWLVLLTMPGAPCIYYGDEIGMTGEMDPGCRGAFPWDASRWDHGLLATLRALIRLRHETAAVRGVAFTPLAAEGLAAAYRRGDGPGSVVVAINAGEEPAALVVDLDERQIEPVYLPELGGGQVTRTEDGRVRLDLPPRSGTLVRVG